MAAVRSNGVDFVVMLAGPGLPGDEILYLQATLIGRAEGASEEAIAANLAVQKRLFGIVRKRGGNPDVTTRLLPGLNHLFQTAKTGSPSEYASITETMSPVALEAVSGWILERFAPLR